MWRSDLDALPVKEETGLTYASTVTATDDTGRQVPVMHACGHDIHMTTLIGLARGLKALQARWSGTVVLIGQPAEERVLGAEAMIKDGLFTRFPRPDFVLGMHVKADLPVGVVGYRAGPRSEEHTSELQSLAYLVCRLLLEKKKKLALIPRSTSKTKRSLVQLSISGKQPP